MEKTEKNRRRLWLLQFYQGQKKKKKSQRFSSFLTSLGKMNATASQSLLFAGIAWVFQLKPGGYLLNSQDTCNTNSFLKLWNVEHYCSSHGNISRVWSVHEYCPKGQLYWPWKCSSHKVFLWREIKDQELMLCYIKAITVLKILHIALCFQIIST